MSLDQNHPGEERLLRYLDQELTAAESASLRLHLDECAACEAELQAIEEQSELLAQYRTQVLQQHLPKPPKAWELQLPQRRFWQAPSTWAAAVAAIGVVCAVVYQLVDTPSARADELLKKAVAAEPTVKRPRRIQIRTKSRQWTRVAGIPAAALDPATEEVAALFRAAQYDWDDPLSARSFLVWRERQAEKSDEVLTSPGKEIQIRTRTRSGELAEATLKLRIPELRAVEGALEFRNQERIELADLGELPASLPVVQTEVKEPSTAPEPTPTAPGPGDELRVFAVLRRIGADLGEPVVVTRNDREIRVEGSGVDPLIADQIRSALVPGQGVVVQFGEPRISAPVRGRTTGSGDQPLEKSEAMMARVHALRRLSQRFEPVVEAQLNAADQGVLRGMVRELAASLSTCEADLRRAVRGPQAGPAASPGTDSWQSTVERLFQAGSELDRRIASRYGGGAEVAGEDLSGRVVEFSFLVRAFEQQMR